jgi:pSer/pThr/pTyr-binding forkhead associated (FHA) protein
MVCFKILSGKMAGIVWMARHFPVRIGRAVAADLRLEEPGVWEEHAHLDFDPAAGFTLSVPSGALAIVNGQPVKQTILGNGDLLECGSVKLQFWLAEPRQASLQLREAAVWVLLCLIPAAQIALIYWLAR